MLQQRIRTFSKLLSNASKDLCARSVHTASDRVEVYGANGSPYTKKVKSALRYKQIPFNFHHLMPGNFMGDWDEKGLGHIKAKVIPVIRYANGETQNDSTFILEKVDCLYPTRPIIPSDPLLGFLALFLEDMFDEWGTKVMFGMRWLREVDQVWSARYLIYDSQLGQGNPLKQIEAMGNQFGSRQVERMKIVGCENEDVVMRSFTTIVAALEKHLQNGSFFMLGSSPTVADFALYGQLSQIVIDRTGDQMIRDEYPAVWAWIRLFEDLSGVDPDKSSCDNSQYLTEMLQFASDVYLPFLQANSAAVESKKSDTKVTLWQETSPILHQQQAFKYQHKCYQRIKESFNQLSKDDKERANDLFRNSNCMKYF